MKLILTKPLPEGIHLSQRFGNPDDLYTRLGMKGHNGHDWACPEGTEIYAAHDGVVRFAGVDNSAGLGIELVSHERYEIEGFESKIKTIYWHLQQGGFRVKVGDKVKAGQVIGISGNTGYSTGAHLHFALKICDDDGETLNRSNGYVGALDHTMYYNFGNLQPITAQLKEGSRGRDVETLQKIITFFGLYLKADIYPRFGQRTLDALGKFQYVVMGGERVTQKYLDNEVANGKPVFGKRTRAFINKLITK